MSVFPAVLIPLVALATLVRAEELDGVPLESEVHPGWGLFLVVVGMIVAALLLWRSMRKQLGRIDFEDGTAERGESPERNPDRP